MKSTFSPRLFLSLFSVLSLNLVIAQSVKWSASNLDDKIRIIHNEGGQTLGYSTASGIKILTVGGLAFKDLNRNGKLDKYEDWRLPVDQRAKDLAAQMSIEQIAGLMLYSGYQSIPARPRGLGTGTYNGKLFDSSGAKASDLSDQQIKFLTADNLRHVLVTTVASPEIAAVWSNNVQALVEGTGLGIPSNNSTCLLYTSDAADE